MTPNIKFKSDNDFRRCGLIPVKTKNATEEFLKLAGSWEDSRTTDEIIDDIYSSRLNSTRFEALDGIFD